MNGAPDALLRHPSSLRGVAHQVAAAVAGRVRDTKDSNIRSLRMPGEGARITRIRGHFVQRLAALTRWEDGKNLL